jgi:hypothetical protein
MNLPVFTSPYLDLLKDRINLRDVPFTERGSRLVVFREDGSFSVRMAERWIKRDQQLSAYRKRLPILDELKLTDENGNTLDVVVTTYPHQLVCRTSLGEFRLIFVDTETLALILPSARCGISFLARVDQAEADRRGGVLRVIGEIRRNIAYTTDAVITQNSLDSHEGQNYRLTLRLEPQRHAAAQPVILLNITPRLGFNRYIPDIAAALDENARRWHAWFAAAPPVAEPYQPQYYFAWWVMRAGLIAPRYYITREAMTPSKMYYVGVWQWDAYFHALAYRHIDMRLAHDQLRLQLDHQTPEGMIPDAVHDEGTVTHLTFPVEADVTKPPLIAWTAWKLHQHQPDLEFLNEIYEPVVRSNRWWFEKNDVDGNGLCEYRHPFSSGLDDSPLWDEGMPVESPDLNTYLFLQQEALANIAGAIGEGQDARLWAGRSTDLLDRLLAYSWDPAAGLFWARRNGQPVRVRTPFSLFPLITGRLTEDINARLVAHLKDPRQFWTRYPVPTVALNDPKYDPAQMWRGPTWVNVNYLLIEGLTRTGYTGLAQELRKRTLELMTQRDDIYEYYNCDTGENPPKAAPIFGWSSALFIDLAIQAAKELEK